MDNGCLMLILLVAVGGIKTVQGQAYFVSCNADLDKTVKLTAIGYTGRFFYIIGCDSTQGEKGGSGLLFFDQLDITDCNLQWDTQYVAVITANQGIILPSDLNNALGFSCVRVTGTQTPSVGVTVDPGTATSRTTHGISPIVGMKFTDQASDYTGAVDLSETVGDPVRLNFWITDSNYAISPYGFDIMVKTITVTSGGVTVTLTGNDGAGSTDGCQANPNFGEVEDIGQGYVKVDFNAFMLGTATSIHQRFDAVVEVCAGTSCPNYNCASGSASQAGRRRRDVANATDIEEVKVTGYLQILPYEGYQVSQTYDDTMTSDSTDDITSCEACTDTAIYAVVGVLVAAILLSVGVSLCLFLRLRSETTAATRSGKLVI